MDNDNLNMSECLGSNILAAKDLEDGEVYTATILKVWKHQFEDGIKPVIRAGLKNLNRMISGASA
jgi:hypothetical protein